MEISLNGIDFTCSLSIVISSYIVFLHKRYPIVSPGAKVQINVVVLIYMSGYIPGCISPPSLHR
jgi:hypothetical protein